MRSALDELENRLEDANVAYAAVQWRRHFDPTNEDELGRLEKARARLMLDGEARKRLQRWATRIDDEHLSRRITLLLRHFHQAAIESQFPVYQLRNRIDRAIINFRPRIGGVPVSRVQRSQILRRHPDRNQRREAWLAAAPLAIQIQDDVGLLMQRRQELAHKLGYDDYVSWSLETIGLTRQQVEAFLDELRVLTESPYRAWLAQVAHELALPDGLQPWDLAYAAEGAWTLPEASFPREGLLPAVWAVAQGLGLQEAARGVRVDKADIPYAALCYAVRPPDDVRILLSPRDGHAHYDILFHEFGHALHWRSLNPRSPILRWESPPFNEGMAFLWERLVSEPDWLLERGGIGLEQVVDYRGRWAERTIYRLRALIARATFEYRAYQALEGDLLALFQNIQAEHLGVPFDLASGWADNPFWTSHPVYLQNYVIGQAVASQTLAALKRQFSRLIGEPAIGAWLVENYYSPGASIPWTEKVLRATGAPLSLPALVADLGIRTADTPQTGGTGEPERRNGKG